ncbi:unnamed protein product [Chrysoparadoxa australica]
MALHSRLASRIPPRRKGARLASSGQVAVAISELKALLGGERVSQVVSTLHLHGKGESYHKSEPPDAVIFANSTEEVSNVVATCAKLQVPIIPFGTGTSLEGHVAAREGGICLDLTGMNRILQVNAEDMDVRVEAGVLRNQLNDHLRDTGLFFSVDPGANASLGGMTACSASGTTSMRYGTMRENVLGMTVVLASGEVIKVGGRAKKSSAGYDLRSLMLGSEGTLGVITEIQVRLHGRPAAVCGAVAPFPDLESAVGAVIEAILMGVPMARCELLDDVSMAALNKYNKGMSYPEVPHLFFEFHGTEASVQEQAQTAEEVCTGSNNALSFNWSSDATKRNQLWDARHNAYYAALALRPGSQGHPTDVAVPLSRLAECIVATADDVKASGIIAPIFGHVGDGNFHVILSHKRDDPPDLLDRTLQVNERLIRRALAMGGTCTGEHGVGYGKRKWLVQEFGQGGVDMMASIKRALDPLNILNPGKVVSIQ